MLSGPQKKFCDGIVSGLNQTEAYMAAYPDASEETARRAGSALMTKRDIEAEIQRMRDKAEARAGSAVMTLVEKRKFLARLVRANVVTFKPEDDGDLLAGVDITPANERMPEIHKLRMHDKIRAIEADNDLAGQGSNAEASDAFTDLLREIRQ